MGLGQQPQWFVREHPQSLGLPAGGLLWFCGGLPRLLKLRINPGPTHACLQARCAAQHPAFFGPAAGGGPARRFYPSVSVEFEIQPQQVSVQQAGRG